MRIEGKITRVLPVQRGVSKAGKEWQKRGYVLETLDQYPKPVMFTFFGDKAEEFQLHEGQLVGVDFDLESREFNGRWYTDVSAWKAEVLEGNVQEAQQSAMDAVAESYFSKQPQPKPKFQAPAPQPEPQPAPQPQATESDLPF